MLLPELTPDNPDHLFWSAKSSCMLPGGDMSSRVCRLLISALEMAHQQGRHHAAAMCYYELVIQVTVWPAAREARPQESPPSIVLGWLQAGNEAYRRCTAALPTQWTVGIKRRCSRGWRSCDGMGTRGSRCLRRWAILGRTL